MYLKPVWLLVFLLCLVNVSTMQSTAKIYWTSSTGIHRAEPNGRDHETLLSVTLGDPRAIAVDVANRKIYWADRGTGKIQRANLDGTDIEDLAFTPAVGSLYGIAVDPVRGKVYWVGGKSHKIQRSELDGTNVEDVITRDVTDLMYYPRGLAVDVDAGKIYWTELQTARIFRANMDGTNAEVFITDRLTGPGLVERLSIVVIAGKIYWVSYDQGWTEALIKSANLDGTDIKSIVNISQPMDGSGRIYIVRIAVDPVMGKLYWEETYSGTGKIMIANLDGTDAQQLIAASEPGGRHTPGGMALNVADNKIYWIASCVTDYGRASTIRWANLDGTDAEDLISPELQAPCGIDIDAPEGKMYWTDFGTNKIQRANLDGSHVEDIITTGLAAPTSLALGLLQRKIYWANWKTGDIQRANIDGTQVETIITLVQVRGMLRSARDIAVDAMTGKIYWACYNEQSGFVIQRADLNGANIRTIASNLSQPNGIAIDAARGKVYWTDNGFHLLVSRANLNGGAREDVVTFRLDYADAFANLLRGITVDPNSGKIYWVKGNFRSSGDIRGSGITGIINPRFIALDTVPTVSVEVTRRLATSWGRVRQDALLQNFPNPFNPETWIPFRLSESEHVIIKICSSAGQLVRMLDLGQKPSGAYMTREKAAYWDGRNEEGEAVVSGVYFYQLVTDDGFSATKKMLVVR